MLDLEREEQILSFLKEKNSCTVYELAQKLFVSESTIRRDLTKMEQKGLVTRTFGGAIIKKEMAFEDTSVFLRRKENILEKRELCHKAVTYIQSNTAVFIDSSTTCLQISSMLKDLTNLLIITNGLMLANELVARTKHRVTILGGDVQPSTNSSLGPGAEKALDSLHASLAILSASAVDVAFGFSEQTAELASLKRIMVKNATRTIFLIGDSKIGHENLAKTCDLKDASVLISNSPLPEEYHQAAPHCEFVVTGPVNLHEEENNKQ